MFVTYRTQLRRLSLKMAMKHDTFPTLLILRGVQRVVDHQHGSGGFSDVFRGTYRGSQVALKCLRAYAMMSKTQREILRKASLYLLSPLVGLLMC